MSRPLSVLFVVPDLGVGGAERHVVTLMSGLDRSRFTPSVVCVGEEGPLFDELVAAGVPAEALHRRKQEAVLALIGLLRRMRARRPDVVMVRGYNAEVLGRTAARLAGVRTVVAWVHDVGDVARRTRPRRLADRVLARWTSVVVGMSEAQCDHLTSGLHYRRDQIRLIPNGTDLTRPASPAALVLDPGDQVVVVVAGLRPEKDHATVLEAFARVLAAVPGARLLVVGDGPARAELVAHAAALGIAGRVAFLGTRDDVPAVLAAADVAVLSSRTECAPMALLEAMAAGLPVVATAVGGVPEIVRDGVTGRLVPPGEPAALADALIGLLRDPGSAATMGRAGRERAERHFDVRGMVERTERLLDELATPTLRRLTVVLDRADLGGAETVLLDTVRALDPARVRTDLVCLRGEGALADAFRAAGCPVLALHRRGRFDPRTLPRLVRALRRNRTDVVLVQHHQLATLVLGPIAAALAGTRGTALAVHTIVPDGRCLPRWTGGLAALGAFRALVLLSERQSGRLRRDDGTGRVPWRRVPEWVIPNGVPAAEPVSVREAVRAQLGAGPDDVVIGTVARLVPEKDHDTLLSAFAGAPDERARLVLVGAGPEGARLRMRAAELGITDRVVFTGRRDDARTLLVGFDVFCLSSRQEGTPLAVLEAMLAGLPVVTTDAGDLPEIVTGAGFVVPVGDVAALAARLAELVADPALRTSIGAAARDRAARDFLIERTARRYERMLASVCGDR